MRLSPLAVSLIVFAIIFGGTFVGAFLRNTLPKQHLADDAKDVVRLGTGLVGTMAALVLGLLIASANSSYETQRGEVKRLTANIILLDEMLAQYGPETRPGRDLLRRAVIQLVERIWEQNPVTQVRSSQPPQPKRPLGRFKLLTLQATYSALSRPERST